MFADFLQKVGDELFPKKDGQMLTSDIDYVDVWRVKRTIHSSTQQALPRHTMVINTV